MKKILLFVPVLFLLCSCQLFFSWHSKKSDSDEDNEKPYTQKKVWELETDYLYGSRFSKQYDRYFYFPEYDRSSGEKLYCYTKLDLSSGKRIWKTDYFEGTPRCFPLPVKLDGNKYIAILVRDVNTPASTIMLYSEDAGELCASISYYDKDKMENAYEIVCVSNNWMFVNGSIYWQNGYMKDRPSGLVRLSLEGIDFSKEPKEVQLVEPTVAWKNNDNLQHIFMRPIEKDGVIYFMTHNEYKKDDYCVYGAYDTKTESLLWQRTSQKLSGYGYYGMLIIDDKLYIIEEAQGCYNIKDGSVI